LEGWEKMYQIYIIDDSVKSPLPGVPITGCEIFTAKAAAAVYAEDHYAGTDYFIEEI